MPDTDPTSDKRPIAPTDQDRARAKEALGNVCVHDDDTMGQYKTQGWHSPASEDADEIEALAREFAAVRTEALSTSVDREDLVESVARALHATIDEGLEWDLLPDRVQSNYRNHARAVLTALATALGRVPAKPSTRLPASPFDLYALVRLEDAISNIDYPGADSKEWTQKAKVAARELERAARVDERAPFQRILATPAPGWFTFGTHVDQPDLELEFWGAETSPDGLPIWERPAAPAEAVVDAAARALDSAGNVFADVFWTRPTLQAQQRESLLETARIVLATSRQEESRDH